MTLIILLLDTLVHNSTNPKNVVKIGSVLSEITRLKCQPLNFFNEKNKVTLAKHIVHRAGMQDRLNKK